MSGYIASLIGRTCAQVLQQAKPRRRRRGSRATRIERLEGRVMLAVTPEVRVAEWVEQGPGPITQGQVVGMENQGKPASGAVQGIAFHPTNPDLALMATVNGGIWRSINATYSPNDGKDNNGNGTVDEAGEEPFWTPVSDWLPSLAISEVVFNPLDATGSEVLAGTGMQSSSWQGGDSGLIYRSTDGGATWSVFSNLGGTEAGQQPISSLVVARTGTTNTSAAETRRTQILLAGTRGVAPGERHLGGLFRSTDGGRTWTAISGSSTSRLPVGPITSIVADPASADRFYAAIAGEGAELPAAGRGIYVSNDGGATWSDFSENIPAEMRSGAQRIRLATHHSTSATVLYAGVVNSLGRLERVYYRLAGATEWSAMSGSPQASRPAPSSGPDGGAQGIIHFSIIAHPSNPNLVYVGGDNSGAVFVGDRTATTNAWTELVTPGAEGRTRPHTDSRNLVFQGSHLVDLDDGGIYRLRDPLSSRRWESMIGNLRNTEICWSVAYDPINRIIMAGTQDNGSVEQSAPGSQRWVQIIGGDGNYQAAVIDQEGSTEVVSRYSMANNYGQVVGGVFQGWFLRRVMEAGGSDPNHQDSLNMLRLADPAQPTQGLSGIESPPTGFERIPYVVNAADPQRLLIGGNYLYESLNRGQTVEKIAGGSGDVSCAYTALAYGWVNPDSPSSRNANIFYAAKAHVLFTGTRQGNETWTVEKRVIEGARSIRDVVIDPTDWQKAYAVDTSGNVWATADAGRTWAQLVGDLFWKNHQTESIEVVYAAGRRFLLVGGNEGVYQAEIRDLGSALGGRQTLVWSELGRGLPNAIVTDIDYVPQVARADGTLVGNVLVIGTMGRGAWMMNSPGTWLIGGSTLRLVGDGAGDTVRLSRDADNPSLLRVEINGEVRSSLSIPVSAIEEIVYDGRGGNDRLVIDVSNGAISTTKGIRFIGGDGTDTFEFASTTERPTVEGSRPGATYRIADLSGVQIVRTEAVEDYAESDPSPQGRMRALAQGLLGLSNQTRETVRGGFDVPVPGMGTGFGQALNGTPRQAPQPISDSPRAARAASSRLPDDGDSLLRRIFENGGGAFDLADIGEAIGDPEALRSRLDALDSTSGNVTLTQEGSRTRFDMIVTKTLTGESALEVAAMGGALSLSGQLNVSADVRVHLVFGVDEQGFFLDPAGPRNSAGESEPEIIVTNIRATGTGRGRFGILEVTLNDAQLRLDPATKATLDLTNPGVDAMAGRDDGVLRLHELFESGLSLATVRLAGNPAGDDVTLTGDFSVGAVLPGGSEPFTLAGARVNIIWGNIEDLSTVRLEAAVGAGAGAMQIINFVQRTVGEVASGLHSVADFLRSISNQDILGTRIPLLDRSLGDILSEVPEPLRLENAGSSNPIARIGEVYEDRGQKKFVVRVEGQNLMEQGVNVGDRVTYRSAAGPEVQGEIDSVDRTRLVVRFTGSLTQDPAATNPRFEIHRRGGLEQQLGSFLSGLNDLTSLSVRAPTIQGIVRELASVAGVDASTIPIAFESNAITFTPTFTLDPLTFHQPLDFGTTIAGLNLQTGGRFDIAVTPQFRLKVGVSLGGTERWEDRFFIAADTDAEVSLNVRARLDDPMARGSIGFLDVVLSEASATGPNNGLTFSADVRVNLRDPSSTSDGKITLGELMNRNPVDGSAIPDRDLSRIIGASIDGKLDIDPIVLRADIARTTLGELRLELNDFAIDELADLTRLPSVLAESITGNLANFTSFNNITPEMILSGLETLASRLSSLGGVGDLVNKPLPIINKSISQIIDLGQAFLDDLGATSGVDAAQLFTASGVERFLESRLGPIVDVVVDGGQVRFDFAFHADLNKNFPFAFDIGSGRAFIGVTGSGDLRLTGAVDLAVGLGFNTAADLSIGDRVFLKADGSDELRVRGAANIGYDVNLDGKADSAPFALTLSGFGRQFQVADGRALIDLDLSADIRDGGNGDGKLTMGEIVSKIGAGQFGDLLTPRFRGSAQALIPIDGNADGKIETTGTSAADAQIRVGGTLANLFAHGIQTSGEIPDAPDAQTPLTLEQLDGMGQFRVVAQNLEGFVTNGFLGFDNLFDGLMRFLEWGDNLLGLNALDFKLPLIGKTPRQVFDFFSSSSPGSIKWIVETMRSRGGGALGQRTTNDAVYLAADLLRSVFRDTPELSAIVRPIGDVDRDGKVETNGDDLLSIERGGATTPYAISAATFEAVTGERPRFRLTRSGADFRRAGVAYNDPVSYTAGGAAVSGRVVEVEATSLLIEGALPEASSAVTVQIHPEITGVTFLVKFEPGISHTEPFNLGLDALNLSGTFDVTFAGNLTALLGFGINKTHGFFLKTDFSDVPMSGLTAGSPELSLNGKVELRGEARARLGFLDLGLDFPTRTLPDGSVEALTFMRAALSANLDGLGDGRLTLAELTNLGNIPQVLGIGGSTPGIALTVKAALDARLSAGVGSELPGLSAHLVMNWARPDGSPFDVFTGSIPTPSLRFERVALNVGSFLDKVAKPVFQKIDQYNVLKPVIDVLDDEVPIIGKTLFELLIEPLDDDQEKAARFLFTLARTISQTAEQAAAGSTVEIEIPSSFIVDTTRPAGSRPSGTFSGGTGTSGGGTGTSGGSGTSTSPPIPGASLPLIGSFIRDLGQIGVTFPVLDFSNLMQWVMGNDVDLVFVNLPKIEAAYRFNVSFPLFSYGIPLLADVYINAFVGGNFGMFIDLDAGLDTRGLKAGRSFLDGFYIGDFDPGTNGQIDRTDRDKLELGLEAAITAGIDAGVRLLGFPLGHITGQGTIGAQIGIDLNDDNESAAGVAYDSRTVADRKDGKFHLDEMGNVLSVFGGNPLGLFDLRGRLFARLGLRAEVDLLLTSFSWEWGDEWTLLDLNLSPQPDPPDLAELVMIGGQRVLRLTGTTSSDARQQANRSASNNAEGDNIEIVLVDKNSNNEDGLILLDLPRSVVTVSEGSASFTVEGPAGSQWRRRGLAEGQRVRYTSSTGATVHGSITGLTDSRMTIGVDNTTSGMPSATTGFAVLSGKETVRVRKGEAQEDFGPGEGPDSPNSVDVNTLARITDEGNALGGSLGAGNDQVSIDPLLRIPVRFFGADGADTLSGGSAGATLLGGNGNDTLSLSPAPSDLTPAERLRWNSRLDGGAGDDMITGGPGDDLIIGGEGKDTMDGGAASERSSSVPDGRSASYTTSGDDTIVGGGGDDAIDGRDGANVLVGDYDQAHDPAPAADARREGKDVINGGANADAIFGDNRTSAGLDGPEVLASRGADDTLQGGAGDDLIFGGSGNDQIFGGTGNDIVGGALGNDAIDGGDGADWLFGQEGNDVLVGGPGNNYLFGGWHNDIVRGGDQDDYIEGGPDDDSICAGAGNDSVFGGTAALGLGLLEPLPAMWPVPGGPTAFSCTSPVTPNNVPTDTTNAPASIRGQVYDDINTNRRKDAAETGLNGWTVRLLRADGSLAATTLTRTIDLNNNAAIDPATETGIFVFENVPPGAYRVEQTLVSGWTQMAPVSGGHGITLRAGDRFTSADFGDVRTSAVHNGDVSGTAYVDSNGNGVRDPGEPGLPGVTLYADLDGNGEHSQGEPTTMTGEDDPNTPEDESGWYRFGKLPEGKYTIRQMPAEGHRQTQSGGEIDVPPGGDVHGGDFGNQPLYATATGIIFNDLNGDGLQQEDEHGLWGWAVWADLNENESREDDEPFASTDYDGVWRMDMLPPGKHLIRTTPRAGWAPTQPAEGTRHVLVEAGQATHGNNFGFAFGTFAGTHDANGYLIRISDDGTYLEVYDTTSPGAQVLLGTSPLNRYGTLRFDLWGGDDTLTVDMSNGNPIPRGLIVNDWQGWDTLRIIGNGGDNQLALSSTLLLVDGTRIEHSGVDRLEVEGGEGNDVLTLDAAPAMAVSFNGGGGADGLFASSTTSSDNLAVGPGQITYGSAMIQAFETESTGLAGSGGSGMALRSLWIGEGSRVNVPSGAVLRAESLFIADGGTLDIGDGTFILQADAENRQGVLADVKRMIRDGRAGVGITTSKPTDVKGLAAIVNDRGFGRPLHNTLDGQSVDGNSILVKYTYYGDANLDGKIDADDYFRINRGQGRGDGGYDGGDFDDSGAVDLADYTLIDRSYLAQSAPAAAAALATTLSDPIPAQAPLMGPKSGTSRVEGTVFIDLNENGFRDWDEGGVAGVTVYLDADNNGYLDEGEPWTVTRADDWGTYGVDEAGTYSLKEIAPGTYRLRQINPDGQATISPPERYYLLKLDGGEVLQQLDFANVPANGVVRGVVFADGDGDGVRDENEPGVGGRTVFVDLNDNGRLDAGEPSTFTQPDDPTQPLGSGGAYTLRNLRPGKFNVYLEGIAGYATTTPQSGFHPVDIKGSETIDNINFGTVALSCAINGTKWWDVNRNGQREPGEPGVAGVRIYLDTNDNGWLDAGEPVAITWPDDPSTTEIDEGGGYEFPALAPGRYVVREEVPFGFVLGSPAGGAHRVELYMGKERERADFSNIAIQLVVDGNDHINGQDGNDVIRGDNDASLPFYVLSIGGRDSIYGGNGADVIDAQQENDQVMGGEGDDALGGGDGDDLLQGQNGNDLILGMGGQDSIVGGEGNDSMTGNEGDDTYLFAPTSAPATDILYEIAGGGSDTLDFGLVTSAVTMDLTVRTAVRTANLTLDLQDVSAGDGSAFFENVIGSRTAANELIGNAANNLLVGGNVDDRLFGVDGNDNLIGNGGNDAIEGNLGDDRLEGGLGDDNIAGGDGSDTYAFGDDWGRDTMTEPPMGGTDDVVDFSTATRALTIMLNSYDFSVVEGTNLLTHDGAQIEWLRGGLGNDRFAFAPGSPWINMTLDGGIGADTLDYLNYDASVTVDLATGLATGVMRSVMNFENVTGSATQANSLTGNSADNVLIGGSANDLLTGLSGNDQLRGQGGADTLVGGYGDDTMAGGDGDDTYPFADYWGRDVVEESAGVDQLDFSAAAGRLSIDLAAQSISDDWGDALAFPAAQIEHLASGSGFDTLVGGDGTNTWQLIGSGQGSVGSLNFSGIENLTGGRGADRFVFSTGGQISGTLSGGEGSDTLDYSASPGPITIDLAAGTAPGASAFASIENLIGTALADRLVAANAPNTIRITAPDAGYINGTILFSGMENLVGGNDADSFILAPGGSLSGSIEGSGGMDTLSYAEYGSAMWINLQTGATTGLSGFGGIERLVGSSLSDTLTGPDTINNWSIFGLNSGSVAGLSFSGVENLSGGAMADTFAFASGSSITGLLDGGLGNDVLDYRAYIGSVVVDLAGGAATGTGGIISVESYLPPSASKGPLAATAVIGEAAVIPSSPKAPRRGLRALLGRIRNAFL